MNRSVILAGILFISSLIVAQKETDDFTGRWKAPKGDIIIVSKPTSGFIGRTEKENAVVLREVKFSNGKWTAVVLNPKENKIANCELVVKNAQLKIIVRKGVMHKTIIWVKQ